MAGVNDIQVNTSPNVTLEEVGAFIGYTKVKGFNVGLSGKVELVTMQGDVLVFSGLISQAIGFQTLFLNLQMDGKVRAGV